MKRNTHDKSLTRPRLALRSVMPLALVMLAWAAWAAEPIAIHPPQRDSGWSFQVAPYLWGLRIDGEMTVEGIPADVNVSDKEILKHLKLGLMLGAEVRKDRVGVFGDIVAAKLKGDGASAALGGANVDVTLRMIDTKFGVDYLLGPYPLASGTNAAQVTLNPYVGGRYFYMESDVSSSALPANVSGSENWMDPLVGVRTVWDLTRHWNIAVAGNIGGFGVGSDLAAEGLATVGYRFHISKKVTGNVAAGYRAFYQDYDNGGFTYDATMHGPILGLDIEF